MIAASKALDRRETSQRSLLWWCHTNWRSHEVAATLAFNSSLGHSWLGEYNLSMLYKSI